MTEKFKESVDKVNAFGAVLTDLLIAFDCIDHSLFITKLFAFRFSPLSLKLMFSYSSNQTRRIKINKHTSDSADNEDDAPQGFVLGPLLFNIDVIDLFYECNRF